MTAIFSVSYVLSCKLGSQLLALSWPFQKKTAFRVHLQGLWCTIITSLLCSFAKTAGYWPASIKRGVTLIRNQCLTASKIILGIAYDSLCALCCLTCRQNMLLIQSDTGPQTFISLSSPILDSVLLSDIVFRQWMSLEKCYRQVN